MRFDSAPSQTDTVDRPAFDPIGQLAALDPELFAAVTAELSRKSEPVSPSDAAALVEDTLWSIAREVTFGQSVARGMARLTGSVSDRRMGTYRRLVREAGTEGPEIGRIMAVHLVPVLCCGDDTLLADFLETVSVMRGKGLYTLRGTLGCFSDLLDGGEPGAAAAYLRLLHITFSQDLTYNKSNHLAHLISRSVPNFQTDRRLWQIRGFGEIIRTDYRLAEAFLDGMERGLDRLPEPAFQCFIEQGLEIWRRNPGFGSNFLALESRRAIDACLNLQTVATLSQMRAALDRYLRARLGVGVAVRSLSALPALSASEAMVCSDGRFIYLPDEISHFTEQEQNRFLYRCLVRIEAGGLEFNTFDFDYEKALDRCGLLPEPEADQAVDRSDLERFFNRFPDGVLAEDLFTIFEHGRIRRLLARHYPGLLRECLPLLQQEARHLLCRAGHPPALRLRLYAVIALGMDKGDIDRRDAPLPAPVMALIGRADDSVESSAALATMAYPLVERLVRPSGDSQAGQNCICPMITPFGRRVRPDLYWMTHREQERIADMLKRRLNDRGVKIYKSDLKKRIRETGGGVTPRDLQELVVSVRENGSVDGAVSSSLSSSELFEILRQAGVAAAEPKPAAGPVSWYREWNAAAADYLDHHVRVQDTRVAGCPGPFYEKTLTRHSGLVRKIRYAFELLKPERLTILRQWLEGDAFDYRALLDFALDRRAGLMPSERLYIKRLKQDRDVAAVLLVDLSRSTANRVPGSKRSVLDVEKEALVLFCEALQVVGDDFAIAGFSGTGRLGVDYFRIKDVDEGVGEAVKARINAVSPRRSTRMGAAIRHATSQFDRISARVKLLIILGDGFPNDVDYKQGYAIEDTRKALLEARAKSIYAHGITVNLTADARLDDLYGAGCHTVISDVRELPDKLLRIYRDLTR